MAHYLYLYNTMMLKTKIYRFIALSLALVVFTSSVSFSADVHYCQGEFKSMSFVGKAKTCHDIEATAPMKNCKHHQKAKAAQKSCGGETNGCCDNKSFNYDLDQDQQIQNVDFVVNKQVEQFIAAYVFSFYTNITVEKEAIACEYYKPPLIPKDIPVFIQSLLL
jgi:hypothetical protein